MTLAEPFRTLKWATWLGWQIESNWADVRLFLLYMVLKPVSGSMMLVMMFYAAKYITNGGVPPEVLPYIYVSSACYGLVGRVMFGLSNVVISDRENYRMLKYIFISPAQFQAYFLGRGVAQAAEGLLGAVITISVGLMIPDVRRSVNFEAFNLGWLLVFLTIGSVMLWACGMILASAMLNMSRSGTFLSEGIAGVVFLLSGVIFPISKLPIWLQPVGRSLPTTYWLEGMRRAIIGPPPEGSMLYSWSNYKLVGVLAITTAGLVLASQLFYRRSVKRAWRRGKIEEATGM